MKPLFFCFVFFIVILPVNSRTILLNKVILPQKPNTYMEVRHIVLRGTNAEIGEALGNISQSWLNAYPSSYREPIYAMARNSYMLHNYPALYYRMMGIAKAFGVPYNSTLLDLSALPYDVGPFACSIVYYPSNITQNGHSFIARNCDSCLSSVDELIRNQAYSINTSLFSRNYVLEIYPDVGYSSIVFGSLDLVNGVFDGLNSAGLYVGCLNDDEAPVSDDPIAGGNRTGLYILQLARLLLDTCDTIQKAKIKILNAKISHIYRGFHFLVADRTGNSFIFEVSKSNDIHFSNNKGKAQIMTRFPIFRYQDESAFPEVVDDQKSTQFKNYKNLRKFIESTKGKFTPKMAWDEMDKVYYDSASTSQTSRIQFPVRTTWKIFVDQNNLSCKIIYYLNDGKVDEKTGKQKLNFSRPFEFKLGLKENYEQTKKTSKNNPTSKNSI